MKRKSEIIRPGVVPLMECLALVLLLGCRNTAEPRSCIGRAGPQGDAPFTGRWIQSGVDTWIELDLDQRSAALCGEYSFNSANFGGQHGPVYLVNGTADAPQLTLTWNEGNDHFAMSAMLSSDGQSLSGTVSTNGGPPIVQAPFRRIAQ